MPVDPDAKYQATVNGNIVTGTFDEIIAAIDDPLTIMEIHSRRAPYQCGPNPE